jgi:hypothetical protein
LGGRKPLEAIGEIAGGAADYARYLEAADVASKSLFDTWDTGANQILDNSGTRLGEMLADVTKQVESLNESIERAFGDAARETFVAFGEAMVDASSGAEAMKDVVKSLLGTVLRALAEEAFAYAAFYLALGNLPKSIALGAAGAAALVASGVVQAMGEGGIVTGPTRALIGEKGPEAVIPLDRMRGLGTTIIVQGNVVRERDMYRAADKWRRRAYAGY